MCVLHSSFVAHTHTHTHPPIVTCWPTVNGDGSCDVNIEYELLGTDLDLRDVVISIPVPASVGAPVVANIAGEYHFDRSVTCVVCVHVYVCVWCVCVCEMLLVDWAVICGNARHMLTRLSFSRRSILEWSIPVIDGSNTEGALEFSIRSKDANDFFPVLVNFSSPRSYAGISVTGVTHVDTNAAVDYSQAIAFSPERYEIN